MILKYTSVQEIIARVYRDLDIKDSTTRVADMISWAGEAMEKIGVFPALYTKITGKGDFPLIELDNYQARVPADAHNILQIAYSADEDGPFYPMYLNTSSVGTDTMYNSTNSDEYNLADNKLLYAIQDLYDYTYEEALEFLNTRPDKKSQLNGLLVGDRVSPADYANHYDNKYKYSINGGYIKTNIRSGYLMIAYKAIPVDKAGYPEIPDLESFKEAIYWYIVKKLLYPKWAMGDVRDAVYTNAATSFNFYAKQSKAEALMPNTAAERRALLNTWVRLVPEIEEDEFFYKNLGDRQYINLH